MRKCRFTIFLLAFVPLAQAQPPGLGPFRVRAAIPSNKVDRVIDSLHTLLVKSKVDTASINTLLLLGGAYQNKGSLKRDSSFFCYHQALELSQRWNDIRGLFDARYRLAGLLRVNGNYPEALQLTLTNLPIAEQNKDTLRLWFTVGDLCGLNYDMNDFGRQLAYARSLQRLALSGYFERQKDTFEVHLSYLINMALAFNGLNEKDSALYYFRRYQQKAFSMNDARSLTIVNGNLGDVLAKYGRYNEARSHYSSAIQYAKQSDFPYWIANSYLGWAKLFQLENRLDSALHYTKLSLSGFQQLKRPADEMKAASFLNELYTKENQMDSAHLYLALAVALKDSLFNQEKVKQIQNLQFAEVLRQQQIELAHKEARQLYENRLKTLSLLGGLVIVVLVAYFLYRNNRQKQRANLQLQEQKQKVEDAYTALKSSQQHLIQSEKMASLGELTAGIAHEIQNPLNFINNFSEVNNELIEEVKNQKSKLKNEELEELLSDIYLNNEKINHHGKRADAIVKGMLQHSRTSSGQKEPTDINALCDEYLRLSYHGLRAKDKSFNPIMKTEFDESIGKINIIPQDIGRVILNLINNAFYAVAEKKKQQPIGYEPRVFLTTKKVNGKVEMALKDNGNGIPEKVIDKIFQPFFTTKPTGQGTGLGLSLAHDIVKAHGGEIKVKSEEGKGSEFIIEFQDIIHQ